MTKWDCQSFQIHTLNTLIEKKLSLLAVLRAVWLNLAIHPSSFHFLYLLNPARGHGALEPMPADIGQEAGYSLDGLLCLP